MAGMGKTTFAREIFHHPQVSSYFEFRAWVTVGQNCPLTRIMRSVRQQIDKTSGEKNMRASLESIIMTRRSLIVLDDLWDLELWRRLTRGTILGRSTIVLTTRLRAVASDAVRDPIEVPFLSTEESWDLLSRKVFGEGYEFSPLLEKAGKKIADECDGLPLTVVTIADILSKAEKTAEHWNKVAEKPDSVFKDAYDRIYEVLYSSYIYLPQHLKECFLYMGVFPRKYKIPISKLIMLWEVEKFLKPTANTEFVTFAVECLSEIHRHSVVLTCQKSSKDGIKLCMLPSVFWYLCTECFGVVKSQQRLSFRNNVLLGLKDDQGEDATAHSGGEKSQIVVLPRDLQKALDRVIRSISWLRILPIVGMAGIGKTTFAREIFHHPQVSSYFEFRAWVTVGQNCPLTRIMRSVRQQIDKITGEKNMRASLESIIMTRRSLIVLDDLWDLELWRRLTRGTILGRSTIVLTTRLHAVASDAVRDPIEVPLLCNEESWDLLRRKVFGEGYEFSPLLEKAGKKIAEECDGLPLTVVTIADILSKAEKTAEHWNKVAEKPDSVFKDAYDRIYEVLYSSYIYLPQHLKECFLYMGVFPRKYKIPTSKLIMLWRVEEFLKPTANAEFAKFAVKCLDEIHSHSVVLTCQKSSKDGIKLCRLPSVFWYLCTREASGGKLFQVLASYTECFGVVKSQQRLSFHNNVLLGFKDVRDSIASLSTIRSLLCFGLYHGCKVWVCSSNLSLLKVLEAVSIRFYEFPVEVTELTQLKYLALTCNGELPRTISKLTNLQFLIVHRHLIIKLSRKPSYLPLVIWFMKELKHLQVMGSDLIDPTDAALLRRLEDSPSYPFLPKLETLLGVSTRSCTRTVLNETPNLKKLGIQIELAPDASDPPSSSCLDSISHLKKLRSLKLVIQNPILTTSAEAFAPPPPPLPKFPPSLRKLTVSGFGYPWEEMAKIAVSKVEVLKLRCYAFRGSAWKQDIGFGFPKLKYLLIEDTDLVEWIPGLRSFDHVERLIFKNCYRLKGIPFGSFYNPKIELVDCNPSAATPGRFSLRNRSQIRNILTNNSWAD